MMQESDDSAVYRALSTGISGWHTFLDTYRNDAGFSTGLDRVVGAHRGAVVCATGSASAGEAPRVEVWVVQDRSIIAWVWTPEAGSSVALYPRRSPRSIEVDDAPESNWPRDGYLGFTVVYSWGRLPFRGRSDDSPAALLQSFIAELEHSGVATESA